MLCNAPANLHVVIGSRVAVPLRTWELAAKGNYASLKTDDLRFQLDETIVRLAPVRLVDRQVEDHNGCFAALKRVGRAGLD